MWVGGCVYVESSEESGEKIISETNIQTEMQMAQKEDRNTENRIENVGNKLF